MRRLWADVILVLLVMCLAGCKRWDTEYQEITIKENRDGGFMYMGNKILDDGINSIPGYQYRIRMSCGDNDID